MSALSADVQVLRAIFCLPAYTPHIPKLLPNVDLPEVCCMHLSHIFHMTRLRSFLV